ncbi:MAG: PTS sugar transporter subunit IIA [Planctomycetes bacterium]|nr:PTS sugar transporter subunit IIA [Planctomycetota bacterium]
MDHWKLFRPVACLSELRAEDKEAALGILVDALVHSGALDMTLRERALAALVTRERSVSTGFGHGVAIPHVRLHGLVETSASLSVLPGGCEWGAIDGEPVQLVFTVLCPERSSARHDSERHLELMRWLARLARSSDFRSRALAARSCAALIELLREMEAA